MTIAPHSGIVDFGTFTPPNGSEDGIQGEVPAPLASEITYVLSATGWVPMGGGGGGGTVTSVDLTAGTGISVSGGPITTAGSITVTNTAPDKVVTLTGAGTTTVTGTYPSFTITSNDAYTGTVTSVGMTVPTGLQVTGSPITASGTLAVSLQAGYSIPTTASQANWDTAYTDRMKWDGGASGLIAATGRTSLGATTVGSNFFTLTNPSAITFPRINADNTVSALSASSFRTAIGAGTGDGSVTSVDVSGGTTGFSFTGGPITTSGTITLSGTLAVANGGTGQTSYTNGQLLIGNSTGNTLTKATLTAGGNVSITNGAGSITISASDQYTGTVTSVNASGNTTGLTFTGGPITTSGTLTLGGTLVVANGGTGATTAVGARANLGAAASGANSDITSMSGITGSIGTPTYIQFDSGAATPLAAGRLWYDQINGSLNMGMGGGNITQQIGEELYVYGKASSAVTDSPLQIIYQTGTVGGSGVITFAPTVAGITDGDRIIGVATESIALNGFGRVTSFGVVHGITTNGTAYGETWADGDVIWYNPVTGNPTNVKPVAPNIKVQVGVILTAGSGGSGSIQVEVNHGSVLGGTDSNVQLTSPTNLDLLQYYGAGGYWRNLAPSSVSVGSATNLVGGLANQIAYQTGAGATSFIVAPTVANTYLEWSGSAFQWSANPLGTVTSVNASGGTTGLTFSGGPITTSGTLTLAGTLAVANGGTGQTSYTDGQLLIGNSTGNTLTKATLTAGTNVSITNGSGSITINATDQYTGTVTSVAASGGTTGLTFSGSPITTSGTLTMSGTLVVANGGTGATTLTGYVKGNGTSAFTASATIPASDISSGAALTRVNDTNVTLTLGGSPTTALLAATSITVGWSGQLAISRGGTGGSATPTAGAVAYGTGTAYAFTSAGTAGQVLLSTGSTSPSWGGIDGGTF